MLKFSFLIINYNHSDAVVTAIQSALDQTYKNIEVICVDDASSDNSVKVIQEHFGKDERFRLICHEVNQGCIATRLDAIEAAVGDYCFFIDSDDSIKTHAAARVAEILNERKYDLIGFSAEVINSIPEYDKYAKIFEKNVKPEIGELSGEEYLRRIYIERGAGFNVHTKCYKTEVLKEAGKRASRDYCCFAEDYYFILILSSVIKDYYGVDEMLSNYNYGIGLSSKQVYGPEQVCRMIESFHTATKNSVEYAEKYVLGEEFIKAIKEVKRTTVRHFLELSIRCKDQKEIPYSRLKELFGERAVERAEAQRECEVLTDRLRRSNRIKEEALKKNREDQVIKKEMQEKIDFLENHVAMLYASKRFKIGNAICFIPHKIKSLFKGEKL